MFLTPKTREKLVNVHNDEHGKLVRNVFICIPL